MSRFQWLLISIILALGLLAGGILLSRESITPVQGKEEQAEHDETGHQEHQEQAKGPHYGILLGQEDQPIRLEVVSRMSQGNLRLSFYALRNGQALPPAQAQLQASWTRFGQLHPLAFKLQEQAWVAQTSINEPHTFELKARLTLNGQRFDYHWLSHDKRLELTPEQLRENKISLASVGPRTLSETVELPGKIAVDQDRYVHLTPRISGIVTSVYKHLGEAVSKGDLLAVLESRELGDLRLEYLQASERYQQARKRYSLEQAFFNNTSRLIRGLQRGEQIENLHQQLLGQVIGSDRQSLISAYSAYHLASQTHTREQQLLAQNATSRAEFQQAEQAFISARAGYQAAIEEAGRQRRLQLLEREQEMQLLAPSVEIARRKLQALGLGTSGSSVRYELRSPISGRVLDKHIAAGESLAANADAFLIADLSQVWAEMMIPESRLEAVRLGQRVEVISQSGKYRSGGIVSHLGATVEEASRTAESHAEVLNPDFIWKPGMFVTIQLLANPFRVPRAIQQSAVQSIEGQDVVFVRDGEALQAVPVELGRKGQDWVEVRTGLEAGMVYAASNSFLLKAELEKSSASHSH